MFINNMFVYESCFLWCWSKLSIPGQRQLKICGLFSVLGMLLFRKPTVSNFNPGKVRFLLLVLIDKLLKILGLKVNKQF